MAASSSGYFLSSEAVKYVDRSASFVHRHTRKKKVHIMFYQNVLLSARITVT